MTRKFEGIPEKEIIRTEWQESFRQLGERGRETTWGMKDHDKRILGLCVMLEEALARESSTLEQQAEQFNDLCGTRNKIKGLQLENGRLKAKLERFAQAVRDRPVGRSEEELEFGKTSPSSGS